MDFSACEWSVLAIDRAEPEMPDGSRPAEPAVFTQDNIITAWPVKLAMTPLMTDKILDQLKQRGIPDNGQQINILGKPARTSELPWEKTQKWLT